MGQLWINSLKNKLCRDEMPWIGFAWCTEHRLELSLAKSVLTPWGLTAAASATNVAFL